MGSSNSKAINTNMNSNTKKGVNKTKSVSVEQKKKQDAEQQKHDAEKMAALKESIEIAERNYYKNATLSNKIGLTSKLLQTPNINCLGDIATTSQATWDEITVSLESLRRVVGNEEVRTVQLIHRDYWALLLKTSRVLNSLTEKSRVRLRNVTTVKSFLESLIQNQELASKFPEKDKLRFNSCMKKALSGWADKQLAALIEEWHNIGTRLMEKKEDWQKFKDTVKTRSTWQSVLVGIGAIVVVGGLVALIVATAGLAAPVEVAIASWIVPTLVVAFSAITVGGVVLAVANFSKDLNNVFSEKERIAYITERLENMRKHSDCIESELSDTKEIVDKIDHQVLSLDISQLEEMLAAITDIETYLKEFGEQGKQAGKAVKEACRAYLAR